MSLATDSVYRNKFKSKRYTRATSQTLFFLQSSNVHTKVYITFVIDPPLMMAQSRAESTWEINNYGRYINQFPPNIIKSTRQYERNNKKYVDKKFLLCSTKYVLMKKYCQYNIYIYIYIYIYLSHKTAEKLRIKTSQLNNVYIYIPAYWVKGLPIA